VGDAYSDIPAQGVIITVHSEVESDLTLDALSKEHNLSSEMILQSQKQATIFALA